MTDHKNTTIISLGGSLIVPDEIDWKFVKDFKAMIERQIEKGKKFIFITGGGKTARNYQEAAEKVTTITDDDRDWLGIHATRMNAHFIRTVFRDHAHPRINTNPHDLEDFYDFKESVLVASGWRPGFSTDYDSVILAKYLDVKKIINLSNIDYVYDKDPKKFPDAKKIETIDWTEFCKIVGDKWTPGLNMPFDPIASRTASEENLEVVILNGKKLENLEKCIAGEDFVGTVIK